MCQISLGQSIYFHTFKNPDDNKQGLYSFYLPSELPLDREETPRDSAFLFDKHNWASRSELDPWVGIPHADDGTRFEGAFSPELVDWEFWS